MTASVPAGAGDSGLDYYFRKPAKSLLQSNAASVDLSGSGTGVRFIPVSR